MAGELGEAGAGGSDDEGESVGGEEAGDGPEVREVVEFVGSGDVEGGSGFEGEGVLEFHGGLLWASGTGGAPGAIHGGWLGRGLGAVGLSTFPGLLRFSRVENATSGWDLRLS